MNKKIIDYMILRNPVAWMLAWEICTEMQNGWQPLGGVTFANEGWLFKKIYCQAMVKYENE